MNTNSKRLALAISAVALVVGVALVYFFPPGQAWFYPRCVFHQVTGLNCPGCGGLRATHQLLHGHLRAALALNPLIFVVLPVLGWLGVAEALRVTTGRKLANPFKHQAWIWLFLVVVVVFGIARNLPMGLFAALSP